MIFHNELSPLWLDAGKKPEFSALRKDLVVDVAVVGAGITGLTTAYHLAKAGKSVAVLEAGRVAEGESGRTTAHLTHVFDSYPQEIKRRFDSQTAKLVWQGLAFAIQQIEDLQTAEGIDCDFARVPGYLFIDDPSDEGRLEEVEKVATEIGFPPARQRPNALSIPAVGMLEFQQQARFHPLKYLMGLLVRLSEMGVKIYEDTHVADVTEGEPITVATAFGVKVRAKDVVLASHVPMNRVTLHTKQAAYRTYVIGLRVPKGSFPDALLWDTHDPYHYVRLQPMANFDLLIVGGEDHKTGQMKTNAEPFAELIRYAHRFLRVPGEVLFHWSGQIMEPVGGLPFIGENPGTHHEWVATGFSGDGMTLGTLAAHMISERILGRKTPWDAAFDPSRSVIHGVKDFVEENVDFPAYMVKDRLHHIANESLAGLRAGEGGIYKLSGKKLAVSRLDDGRLVAVSPVCTHLGCIVHYNSLERTWDCPCHGSRFAREGGVINGPAVKALEPLPVESEHAAELDEESNKAPACRLGDTPEAWVT